MANAIAFLIIASFFLFCAALLGVQIGTARERERRKAVDAAEHAKALRAAALRKPPSDYDQLMRMLLRTPGFSIETEERPHSLLMRIRRRDHSRLTVVEFTKQGTLLTLEPAREDV